MKTYLLASLMTLASGAGLAFGQATLGTPIASQTPCESCNSGPAAPYVSHSDCRASLCQSGIGQLARSMMVPIRFATGNLLPNCCADEVTKADVARMVADGGYSPAEIAAVKIKLDESQAKARRAAVRYLATVDCHYYPEAETGLIAALRADRSECVRLEAALALGTCQCLTSRIVDALSVATMGCEIDGNPAEMSPRVRSAAQVALNRCLSQGVCVPTNPPQMLPPPGWSAPMPFPAAPQPSLSVQPASYYVPTMPESIQPTNLYLMNRAESASGKNASLPTGQRSLYHLFVKATSREASEPSAIRPPVPLQSLGLVPLGSEVNLAIPRANSPSAPLVPAP